MHHRYKHSSLSPITSRYPTLFMARSSTSKRSSKPSEKRRAGEADAIQHAKDAHRHRQKTQAAAARRSHQQQRTARVEEPGDSDKVRRLQGKSATPHTPRLNSHRRLTTLQPNWRPPSPSSTLLSNVTSSSRRPPSPRAPRSPPSTSPTGSAASPSKTSADTWTLMETRGRMIGTVFG